MNLSAFLVPNHTPPVQKGLILTHQLCRSFNCLQFASLSLLHLIFFTCHFFLFHTSNPPSSPSLPPSTLPSFTRLPDPSPPCAPLISPLADPFRLIPIFSLIVIKSHSVSSWQECEICQGKAIKVTADWNRLGEQQGKWREAS